MREEKNSRLRKFSDYWEEWPQSGQLLMNERNCSITRRVDQVEGRRSWRAVEGTREGSIE